MKKRLLSVLLAGTMTMGLLAGCGNSAGSDSEAGENGSAAEENGAQESDAGAGEAVEI